MKKQEIEKMLTEYRELKDRENELKKRAAELREKILGLNPDRYGSMMLTMEEVKKECFSWKKAKTTLSPSVLSKLTQFVDSRLEKRIKVTKVS